MFNHYYTLKLVAETLDRECAGAVIADIFSQEKNELIIVCRTPEKQITLQVSTDGRYFHFFRRDNFHRAKKNSVDLFQSALGKNICSISIERLDRIVTIALGDGSFFSLHLFPGKANIYFFSAEEILVELFKKEITPPTIAQRNAASGGQEYDFIDESKLLAASRTRAEMKNFFPHLGKTLFEEMLYRAELHLRLASDELQEKEVTILLSHYRNMLVELETPQARMYFDEDRPAFFSLISLHSCSELREERYDDVHYALHHFFRRKTTVQLFQHQKEALLKSLHKHREHVEHSLQSMESETGILERALVYEKYGSLLMSAAYEVPLNPRCISIVDIFLESRPMIEIPILAEFSVIENAQRYFEKAKHCKSSIAHVRVHRKKLERTVEEVDRAIACARACSEYSALKDYISSNTRMLASFGINEQGEKQTKPFPFRRFVVRGGYEVWAGKSSANNDELTLHHAQKNDLWFHARGVGGSHVVLKTGNAAGQIPKETIEAAAEIAAYYSKARKAKSVAVAFTEKKYVRKPRGVSPGTVVIEKEKVIFVQPKLPKDQPEN